jgi:hypothetical protein
MFLLPILAETLGGFEAMATSDTGRIAMFILMGVCAIPVGLAFPLLNGALMARAQAQGRGMPMAAMWMSSLLIMGVLLAGTSFGS